MAPQAGLARRSAPWIFASAYIVVLGVCLLVRFRLGAWKRMRLSGEEVVV